jgi:hypothetical protein
VRSLTLPLAVPLICSTVAVHRRDDIYNTRCRLTVHPSSAFATMNYCSSNTQGIQFPSEPNDSLFHPSSDASSEIWPLRTEVMQYDVGHNARLHEDFHQTTCPATWRQRHSWGYISSDLPRTSSGTTDDNYLDYFEVCTSVSPLAPLNENYLAEKACERG